MKWTCNLMLLLVLPGLKHFLQGTMRLLEQKNQAISKKRIDLGMVDQVTDFIAQVNTVCEIYTMKGSDVVNYDETHVWLTLEGHIRLEHVGKTCLQKLDKQGMNVRTLVSLIAADGSVLMS